MLGRGLALGIATGRVLWLFVGCRNYHLLGLVG